MEKGEKRSRKEDTAPAAPPPKRSKKGKKKAKANDISVEDYVRLVPVPRRAELCQEGWQPVLLSKVDKAPQAQLSEDRRSVTSWKGYRMARATHGAHKGTWYFEVRIAHLGATGHCRLGWATQRAELQAPVGYDSHSYGYRDLEGSKVHRALREPYGEAFAEGDVIGCVLHIPGTGRTLELDAADIVTYKGTSYVEVKPEEEPRPMPGSFVAFTRNGIFQDVAYRDIMEGTYYPASSTYTLPEQAEGATVTFNFGPEFAFPPSNIKGCPPPLPAADLAGSPDDIGVDLDRCGEQAKGGAHASKAMQITATSGAPDPAEALKLEQNPLSFEVDEA